MDHGNGAGMRWITATGPITQQGWNAIDRGNGADHSNGADHWNGARMEWITGTELEWDGSLELG
jgi:hypothetical protein